MGISRIRDLTVGEWVYAGSVFEIHMIPSAIALFVLFLYLEFMRHEKPNTMLLAISSTLLGSYIIVLILELVFKLELGVIDPEYRVSRIILNIFQAFVLGEAFYVYIKDTIKAEYKKLKRVSFIIATATGIGFVSAFLKIFERWTVDHGFWIYGAIPFSVTFGILALAFIFNPEYRKPSRLCYPSCCLPGIRYEYPPHFHQSPPRPESPRVPDLLEEYQKSN